MHGLRLKERLEAGDLLNLNTEQAASKHIVERGRSEALARLRGDDSAYAGVPRGQVNPDYFLGVRYGFSLLARGLFLNNTRGARCTGEAR